MSTLTTFTIHNPENILQLYFSMVFFPESVNEQRALIPEFSCSILRLLPSWTFYHTLDNAIEQKIQAVEENNLGNFLKHEKKNSDKSLTLKASFEMKKARQDT